jgi:hypothetical protein
MRRLTVLTCVIALALGLSATASNADNPHGGPPGQLKKQPPAAHCDPIDTTQCLLPFPDDFYTVADASTPTGRRVNFPGDVMPISATGKQIDPSDWNQSDGFSPGATIMARVPGIDIARTGIARSNDIGSSLADDAPVVLLDTTTGQRVPYFGELDTWNTDDATRALVVRPAVSFGEGHHIVVALRNMKNAAGSVIPASPEFAQFRDHRPTFDTNVVARKFAMNRTFAQLESGGVRRQSLYLAWDFTVASQHDLSSRMLHMRDDAYAQLGSGVPAFQVTSIDANPNSDVLRRVHGTFDVPLYMTNNGAPGGRLVLDANDMPVRVGTYHAEFQCLVPNSSVGADGHAAPGRAFVYGHGLLGSTNEINGFAPFVNQYDITLCATPEIGMANDDIINVVNVISDYSTFGSIPDRLQQGLLNTQFLARLLNDPRGFASDPAFRVGSPAGASILPNDVFYNGNSQGGIFGGAATAISKEWTRAVLGVPAMNYSVLLPRSVDFDPQFRDLLKASYPDQTVQTLLVALSQMLWDRGEPNGYAQHLTRDPYPGTPLHTLLLIEAFGDHQVANVGTEIEARTIGAFVHQPALAPGRSNDVTPMWNIPAVPSSPFNGSVLEIWDFGTPAPPIDSIPNTGGSDPHGSARNVPAVRDQVSQFLSPGGTFVNVCRPDPCHP